MTTIPARIGLKKLKCLMCDKVITTTAELRICAKCTEQNIRTEYGEGRHKHEQSRYELKEKNGAN